jgi:hypothetical protein
MRRIIAPFNWHSRDGKYRQCRFPVLCMYDDMLIWEIDGTDKRRATWRRARYFRQEMDEAFRQYIRDTKPS